MKRIKRSKRPEPSWNSFNLRTKIVWLLDSRNCTEAQTRCVHAWSGEWVRQQQYYAICLYVARQQMVLFPSYSLLRTPSNSGYGWCQEKWNVRIGASDLFSLWKVANCQRHTLAICGKFIHGHTARHLIASASESTVVTPSEKWHISPSSSCFCNEVSSAC